KLVQFRKERAKREGCAARREWESGSKAGKGHFTLRLAEIEKSIGRLRRNGKAAASFEKRDGTAEACLDKRAKCGGWSAPVFLAHIAAAGCQNLTDLLPFGLKRRHAGFYGHGFLDWELRRKQEVLGLKEFFKA